MQKFLLSCDWGTSSFRLKLVEVANRNIIHEVSSDTGTARIYNVWKAHGEPQKICREDYYLQHLQKEVEILSDQVSMSLNQTVMVVSGMACSSIGIMELPYAELPFNLDGRDAVVQPFGEHYFPNKAWLISGVSHQNDVMRGEEAQMIGLAAAVGNLNTDQRVVCVFPGTHSKHLIVADGKIVDFQTYMTGELFEVLMRHTILRDSIATPEEQQAMNNHAVNAFQLGIKHSEEQNLLHSLFSVRINQLFNYLSREENYFYLSGLLIGSELRSLNRKDVSRIIICGGNTVSHLYQLAFEELDMSTETLFISSDIADRAAVEGQIKIYENKIIKL